MALLRPRYAALLLALVCFFSGFSSPAVRAEEQLDVLAYLQQAKEFYKGVEDYTCTFYKQERLDGKLKKMETIFFKFQKPFKVYMKWTKDPNKGRELLFVPGKYDNKLKVHLGGLIDIILPSITISPDSPHVLKNTRHSITSAGMGNMINSLIDQFELARQQGDLQVVSHGTEKVDGVECLKIERILPKDKGYYCHRLMLFLDKRNFTPAKVMIYDWDNQLIENYSIADVKWNVGLTDEDFDSKNKEYAFGMF